MGTIVDMVMTASTGQLLVWGAAGLIGLFTFIGIMMNLLRGKSTSADAGEAMAAAGSPVSGTPTGDTSADLIAHDGLPETLEYESAIITDINSKSSSWGFWPWALISLLVLGALGWLILKFSIGSGADSFRWVLWALLPMAGLISLLGIAQMTRRHPMVDEKRGSPRGLGFLTLISGLVLGLASWFVWQPRVDSDYAGLSQVKEGLASKLISRDTVIARLQGELEEGNLKYANLEKDINAGNSDNGEEVGRLNGVIARLTKNNTSIGADNTRLQDLLKAKTGNAGDIARLTELNGDLKGQIGSYKNEDEVQGAKIASLEAELTKMRNKPAVVPAPAPAPTTVFKRRDTPLGLIHRYNQDETKMRLTSSDYNMVKSPKVEMVNGKQGHYYNIFLKNPANGKGYNFASARYNKIDNDRQFKQSLDRVISDIRGAFDGKRNYQIYVKGKASAGRYTGELIEGFEYADMTVMENSGGSFGPAMVNRHYGPAITNDDLPNLRGAYLQDFLAKNYKINKPVILDGKVSTSNDKNKQAVAVILYVED